MRDYRHAKTIIPLHTLKKVIIISTLETHYHMELNMIQATQIVKNLSSKETDDGHRP